MSIESEITKPTYETHSPEAHLQRWADALAASLTPKEAGYLAASLAMKREKAQAKK